MNGFVLAALLVGALGNFAASFAWMWEPKGFALMVASWFCALGAFAYAGAFSPLI